jgi:hypothetical protein
MDEYGSAVIMIVEKYALGTTSVNEYFCVRTWRSQFEYSYEQRPKRPERAGNYASTNRLSSLVETRVFGSAPNGTRQAQNARVRTELSRHNQGIRLRHVLARGTLRIGESVNRASITSEAPGPLSSTSYGTATERLPVSG